MDEDESQNRVLIKLSGEAFGGQGRAGVSSAALEFIAGELAAAYRICGRIGVVVGAGNLLRGADLARIGVNPIRCDQAGMVATVVNGLALQEMLALRDVPSVVFSAFSVGTFVRRFALDEARDCFRQDRIAVFVGGTGNPLFTTDTAAALRAIETGCRLLLKATTVDGVYSEDPKKNPNATLFKRLTFQEAIEKRLGVMDMAAFELCSRHKLPIRVFNFSKPGVLARILGGEDEGTLVC